MALLACPIDIGAPMMRMVYRSLQISHSTLKVQLYHTREEVYSNAPLQSNILPKPTFIL